MPAPARREEPGPTYNRVGRPVSKTTSRVFVVDAYYGNDPQDLGIGHSPVWSPDGTRLAFSSPGEGPVEVLIVDADGTGRRKLAEGQDKTWSPDGLTIAFTRTVEGVDGVFVIGVDGTGERYLGEGSGPVWSPGRHGDSVHPRRRRW